MYLWLQGRVRRHQTNIFILARGENIFCLFSPSPPSSSVVSCTDFSHWSKTSQCLTPWFQDWLIHPPPPQWIKTPTIGRGSMCLYIRKCRHYCSTISTVHWTGTRRVIHGWWAGPVWSEEMSLTQIRLSVVSLDDGDMFDDKCRVGHTLTLLLFSLTDCRLQLTINATCLNLTHHHITKFQNNSLISEGHIACKVVSKFLRISRYASV